MANTTVAQALVRAQQFEDEDKFEQAYECYKYAHELDKTDTDALQKLATCAQMLQYNNDAINYWNMYMQIKPEDPLSYSQLLDLYFHENKYEYYMTRAKLKTIEGRLPQATDDYKKAINNTNEDKEIIDARYLLAQTYKIIGKPLQAIDEYLKILDHDHNEAVYLSLADLYYAEDKSAALNVLQQAIERYPNSNIRIISAVRLPRIQRGMKGRTGRKRPARKQNRRARRPPRRRLQAVFPRRRRAVRLPQAIPRCIPTMRRAT